MLQSTTLMWMQYKVLKPTHMLVYKIIFIFKKRKEKMPQGDHIAKSICVANIMYSTFSIISPLPNKSNPFYHVLTDIKSKPSMAGR